MNIHIIIILANIDSIIHIINMIWIYVNSTVEHIDNAINIHLAICSIVLEDVLTSALKITRWCR